MTDWNQWHRSYDDPATSLARRLVVVQRRLVESIVALNPGPQRIVSLCAGDGRDLLPILSAPAWSHRRRCSSSSSIPELANAARRAAMAAGLYTVRVVEGDAADTSLLSDHRPIDLLLLCGIFGNVSELDIRTTIGAAAALVREGGHVNGQRGDGDPDLRPQVRRSFRSAAWPRCPSTGTPSRSASA